MIAEGKWSSSIIFFLLQILILMYIFVHFVIFAILRGEIIGSDIVFEYFACIKALINKIGYSYIDGRTHDKWIIKSSKKNRYDCIACSNGCDYTSTNGPDPIKTPQLIVLGRE